MITTLGHLWSGTIYWNEWQQVCHPFFYGISSVIIQSLAEALTRQAGREAEISHWVDQILQGDQICLTTIPVKLNISILLLLYFYWTSMNLYGIPISMVTALGCCFNRCTPLNSLLITNSQLSSRLIVLDHQHSILYLLARHWNLSQEVVNQPWVI